jgi:hypothetical protein
MFGDGRFYPKHDSLPAWVLVHPRQLNHVLSYRRFVSPLGCRMSRQIGHLERDLEWTLNESLSRCDDRSKARFENQGRGELTCRRSFSSRNDIPKRGPRDLQQRYPRCSSSLLSALRALLLSGGLGSSRQLFHRRNCSPIRAFL